MMRRELLYNDVENVLRRSLRKSGDSVAAPDLWPAVRARIAASGRAPWWSGAGRWLAVPGWVAPAGTVAFVLVAVVLGLVMLNNSDDANSGNSAAQQGGTAHSPDLAGSPDAEVFTGALRALESAGPFRVDSESFIPSYTVGGTLDFRFPPLSSESLWWQRYPDATVNSVPHDFWLSDEFRDADCKDFESGHICDRVWIPSGETLGTNMWYSARHVSAGIFVSPETYRTRKQLRLDPDLKHEIASRSGRSDFSMTETVHEFWQEDGLSHAVDGINRSPSRFPEVSEGTPAVGSLYAFLMAHLTAVHVYQFLELKPRDIVDEASFSNIERVTPRGETESDGLVHYRADIRGFLGDEGIWEMWLSPADGLPRRISIEAFSASDDPARPLDVTRATLTFSRFGEDMGIYDDLLLLPYP